MSLKSQINSDYIKAFKGKDVLGKSLLSTLKGEIQTIEKNLLVENLSDEDVTRILNKFAKSLRENISLGIEKSKDELAIVESYLPKSMTAEDVSLKLDELISAGTSNTGQIMKEFATLQVDKKMVMEFLKGKLEVKASFDKNGKTFISKGIK